MAMKVVYTNVCGQLIHEDRGGVETEYVPDTLGSVMMCRSATGTTTYTADCRPYGEVASSTGSNPSAWGFGGTLGYYTDPAPGSVYVRARIYLAGIGRWATVDPLWPDESAYSYPTQPQSVQDQSGSEAGSPLKNYGKCGVYECYEHEFACWGTNWIPTHAFTCVTGPSGGCSGGFYQKDGNAAGPGEIRSETQQCPNNQNPRTECVLRSTSCLLSALVCECLKDASRNPPYYIIPFSYCMGFNDRMLRCACAKLDTLGSRWGKIKQEDRLRCALIEAGNVYIVP